MTTAVFVQARLGSTRLPGKVLLDLGGKPVLRRVLDRVKAVRSVDEVIVLTTLNTADLSLVRFVSEQGVRVFCGSENDVLDRFYQAARLLRPKHIVRITADCPVIDPAIVEEVVARHHASQADYTSNTLIERYPDGEDTEVMTFDALERSWKEADLASDREHVTPYIRRHPEFFKTESVVCEEDYSGQRWTLDTDRDYLFLSALYRELGGEDENFGMQAILSLLDSNDELRSMNSGILRNEGYLKSLREDRVMKGKE